MMLAAAATIVLAVLAALLWRGAPASGVQTVAIPSAAATLEPVSMLAVADPVLAEAEREYESAANDAARGPAAAPLLASPPRTSRESRTTSQVIDRALAEVREALAKDPVNPELNRMLVATHRKKVDVLRRVVRLSTAL